MAACERDVDDLIKLAERMFPRILERKHGLVHALNRGGSGIGMAASEATGIPIDTRIVAQVARIVGSASRASSPPTPIASTASLTATRSSQEKFAAFLAKHKIAWPRTPKRVSCAPTRTRSRTWRSGMHHKLLNPLRETLSTLGQMRLNDLRVGSDGRNRAALQAVLGQDWTLPA